MNWIALVFALEIGAMPFSEWQFYGLREHHSQQSVYTELESELRFFDVLYVGGAVRTDVNPLKYNQFDPFWASYSFSARVKRGNIEAGFRHFCTHEILTAIGRRDERTAILDGGYEEVYIRITGESRGR